MAKFNDGTGIEDGKVEYDLRDYERASFGKAYKQFNDLEAKTIAKNDSDQAALYFSLGRTIIQMTKRYIPDDTDKDIDPERALRITEVAIQNLDQGVMPEMRQFNILRETIEDMRHEAGLNLPINKQEDPTESWKVGV